VGRNGQFGWLAQSAGVRRNPHEHAGTGAIRQDARRRSGAERSQADPKGERHQWRAKKKPQPGTVGVLLVVEAAGIEPASESSTSQVLHV